MATKKKKEAEPKADPDPVPAQGSDSLFPRKYSFNILEDEDRVEQTKEALISLWSRMKNRPMNFCSLAEVRRAMIPYRHFYVQWALGCYGIPEGTILEIIGAEHLGKSTFCHWLMGGAMLQGVPCSILETEGKPLESDWASRALHRDKTLADKMLRSVFLHQNVFRLDQMEDSMFDWLATMRGEKGSSKYKAVPIDTPLLMVVDTWSKLQTPAEAEGVYDYGTGKPGKMSTSGTGSNQGHAKFAHQWSRRVASVLSRFNASLIIVSQQNEYVNMSSTPNPAAAWLASESGSIGHKRKIGGRALNQSASIQLVMAKGSMIKDSNNDKIGTTIKIRVDKNSYGPKERVFEMDLIHDQFDDTETTQAPSVDFDRPLATMFAEKGILQTTLARKRYSSPVLDVQNVTAREFCDAFHSRPDLVKEVGMSLKIKGYEQFVDQAREQEAGDEN